MSNILIYMNQSLYEFATHFKFIVVARSIEPTFASGNRMCNASQNVHGGPRSFFPQLNDDCGYFFF